MHSLPYRFNRSFKWRTLLLTALLVYVFIQLGLWQWHKAEARKAMAVALKTTQFLSLQLTELKQTNLAANIHSRKVRMSGHYLPEQTLLIDNQLEQGRPGFHVLTAFQLDDTSHVVWINRGWVAGFSDHHKLPEVATTYDHQTISGLAWQIRKTAFQLKPAHVAVNTGQNTEIVQQVIDFKVLQQRLPQTIPQLIIKLDADVPRDGFVRHWQLPEGEIEKNMGYAYQWFGFAMAAVLICLYQMLEKPWPSTSEPQNQLQDPH